MNSDFWGLRYRPMKMRTMVQKVVKMPKNAENWQVIYTYTVSGNDETTRLGFRNEVESQITPSVFPCVHFKNNFNKLQRKFSETLKKSFGNFKEKSRNLWRKTQKARFIKRKLVVKYWVSHVDWKIGNTVPDLFCIETQKSEIQSMRRAEWHMFDYNYNYF